MGAVDGVLMGVIVGHQLGERLGRAHWRRVHLGRVLGHQLGGIVVPRRHAARAHRHSHRRRRCPTEAAQTPNPKGAA